MANEEYPLPEAKMTGLFDNLIKRLSPVNIDKINAFLDYVDTESDPENIIIKIPKAKPE